jgi:hypothetical protein
MDDGLYMLGIGAVWFEPNRGGLNGFGLVWFTISLFGLV